MSWPTRTSNQTRWRPVAAVSRTDAGRLVAIAAVLLLMFEMAGRSAIAFGQENPLRDGAFGSPPGFPGDSGNEPGYLEQLLPSLQKIQAEGATGVAPQPNLEDPAESLASQVLNGTEAGAWSSASNPERSPVEPEPALIGGQTETRLFDSRPATDWNQLGTATAVPGSASPTLPKSAGIGSGVTRSAKGGASAASGRLTAFQGVESLQLNSTLVKVGLNTLLVLAATVGLIMVVRKTLPRQATSQPRPVGKLRIEQSLSLGGKAELKIVRCGLNQVLVAIDGGGIRSVVALEPALETEREHLEPAAQSQSAPDAKEPVNKEPVNIEQFVKMIKDMEGDFMAARTGR